MKFKVETIQDYHVAYLRRIGRYGSANTEVMERLKINRNKPLYSFYIHYSYSFSKPVAFSTNLSFSLRSSSAAFELFTPSMISKKQ
ncbi:hypothetical protein DFO70_10618 [Cytobacillus firmus]|uniref:Uncharacterized protein n=2 Tax=Cytobacillus TaxID=2675230 RepID=A0A366JXV1_CYTFI|nr:hypothetical protein DFO70_10618 [Cytobacillus firmus]TDX42491.1 hypothetical protein DFO72_10618 [Cytobacillus oceanisediminis]